MSAAAIARSVARAHALALLVRPDSDAELLTRFTRHADADAFERLVDRYAPLVWAVCRRRLACEADREDAFQATFLCLLRQARSLDPGRPLGGWLHTAAARVARKAAARSARLRPSPVPPERPTAGTVLDQLSAAELLRSVDEEIARLPAKLREPLVLCCLEGQTRDEAAVRLRCTPAALKSRLERARAALRRRLQRRGVELPAAFLVLGLTAGPVPAVLRAKAAHAALHEALPAVMSLAAAAAASLLARLAAAFAPALLIAAVGVGVIAAVSAGPSAEAPPKTDAPAASTAKEETRLPVDRYGDPLPEGAVRRFGTVRFRHAEVCELAFTPDGGKLLAGSGRTPLSVFEARSGRRLGQIGKHSINNPYKFALSADGKRVACCGRDVTLWDAEAGTLLREFGFGRAQAVALSPEGKRIAMVGELRPDAQVYDADTGTKVASWKLDGGLNEVGMSGLAYSPDGKRVAALVVRRRQENLSVLGVVYATARLWDAKTGAEVREFGSAEQPLHAFAFQPGTGRLAAADGDGSVRFWDPESGKEVRRIEAGHKGEPLTALCFSADGRRLALCGRNRPLSVWDLGPGKELLRVDPGPAAGAPGPVTLALSPDGKAVACGLLYGQSCVRVWDVETGAEHLADAGHRGPATLTLAGDGRTLVSRGRHGRVFHWDLRTGEGRVEPPDARPAADASPWATNPSLRGPRWECRFNLKSFELEVWSPDQAKLLRKVKMPELQRGHAVSPDGRHLAVAFQDAIHTVFLWDPEREEEPRRLSGHPDACQQLLFSHDGRRLITGAGTHNAYPSETLFVWDVATGKLERKLPCNSSPGFMLLTADDRTLITGGLWNDATVRAFDLDSGKQLATLADPALKVTSQTPAHIEPELRIAGLTLSPEERLLAVVSTRGDESFLTVWETGAWLPVRSFPPMRPQTYVSSAVFSRDGRSLFVAGFDSTILEWDVSDRHGKHSAVPDAARLDALWKALAEAPPSAYPAAWELQEHPAEAVAFLKGKLAPVAKPDAGRLTQLVLRLDAVAFREREGAARQLLATGEAALPALRDALRGGLSAEAKARAEKLIEALSNGPQPEEQRLLRAVGILEWVSTSEAEEHLRALAAGVNSRLTRAAQAALSRLKR